MCGNGIPIYNITAIEMDSASLPVGNGRVEDLLCKVAHHLCHQLLLHGTQLLGSVILRSRRKLFLPTFIGLRVGESDVHRHLQLHL